MAQKAEYCMQISIRIQVAVRMRIHLDPDMKHARKKSDIKVIKFSKAGTQMEWIQEKKNTGIKKSEIV